MSRVKDTHRAALLSLKGGVRACTPECCTPSQKGAATQEGRTEILVFEPISFSPIFVKHYSKSETYVSSIKLKMFVMTHCSPLRSDPSEGGEGAQVRFGNKPGNDGPGAFWAQKPPRCFSNKQYSFLASFFSHSSEGIVKGIIIPAWFFWEEMHRVMRTNISKVATDFCRAPCLRAQLELTELIYQKHQLHTNPTESLGAEGYQHS